MLEIKVVFTEDEVEELEPIASMFYEGYLEPFVHDAALAYHALKLRETRFDEESMREETMRYGG